MSRSVLCVDVNVLVYAHRSEAPDHLLYRAWLEDARTAREPLGLADVVASGFLRIVTHPRIFRTPTPPSAALEFVAALGGSPSTTVLAPGERHWHVFEDLCRKTGATGNLVPDAYLAALAIEQGAMLVSADRGLARFPDLRLQHPLDAR